MRLAFTIVILVLMVRPALADDGPRVAAVLPLVASSAKVDDATRRGLEASIRTAAGDHLSKFGYTVLTGEETRQRLSGNCVDATKVDKQGRAVSAALELKAQVYVTGSIARESGDYLALVHMFDVTSGKELASAKLKGANLKELRAQFAKQAPRFFSTAVPDKSVASSASVSDPGTSAGSGPGDTGAIHAPGGINGGGGSSARKRFDTDLENPKERPSFVPGRTTVMGSLTADEVGRIFRCHWSEIRACYKNELKEKPNLAGYLDVCVEIDADGGVSLAKVADSDLHDNVVEQCVVSNIRRWRFQPPHDSKPVYVNYPFIFQAQM